MTVEERWRGACQMLTLSGRSLDVRLEFGLCFPGMWRGKSNFAPVKASLLKTLLGENWYERIYDDPKAIWLTPGRFQQWKRSPSILSIVSANLTRWISSPQRLDQLSAAGWAKLLQVAYDFELLDLFHILWAKCLANPSWSPEQKALFFQTQ